MREINYQLDYSPVTQGADTTEADNIRMLQEQNALLATMRLERLKRETTQPVQEEVAQSVRRIEPEIIHQGC